MIKCENCGAEFDIHEECCPYCGYINFTGAEEKYIKGLQDIKSDLAQVDDEAERINAQTAKRNIKLVLIILLIVFILIIGCLLWVKVISSVLFSYKGTYTYESDPKKEAAWMQEHAPDLDALYEAGDIDSLVEIYEEMHASKDIGAFFNWEHSYLVVQASTLKTYMDIMDSGQELSDFDIRETMFNALYYYNGDYKGCDLTKKDMKILEGYAQKYLDTVYNRFNISDDVMEDMKRTCTSEGGYVMPSETGKYVEKHMDIFR